MDVAKPRSEGIKAIGYLNSLIENGDKCQGEMKEKRNWKKKACGSP